MKCVPVRRGVYVGPTFRCLLHLLRTRFSTELAHQFQLGLEIDVMGQFDML